MNFPEKNRGLARGGTSHITGSHPGLKLLFTICSYETADFVVPARKNPLFYTDKTAKAVTPEHEEFRREVPGEPERCEFRMISEGL